MEHTEQARSTASPAGGEHRAAVVFSIGVAGAALAWTLALVVAGAARPPFGPILLLAIAAALCVNRFVLFPTEHAATAEAAVLLAAVVGLHADAPYVGPLAVALLVGPLDALHWEQRSFARMAYNAGNRGLATLAAAGTFAGARDLLGASTPAWVITLAVAAAAFALVDLLLSFVLLRLNGSSRSDALSHLVDVDALTFPLAYVGGAAGILAIQTGWWAAVLVLLAAAFVPELVVARASAQTTAVHDLALLLVVVAIVTTVVLVTPDPSVAMLAALAAVSVLAGVEFAVDAHGLVPPMVATVVVAGAVVGGGELRLAAVLAAVVATTTSWWCGSEPLRVRFLVAVTFATGAAALASQVALEWPQSSGSAVVGACVTGAVFAVVTAMVDPIRTRVVAALGWSLPVVAAAAAWSAVWSQLGIGGVFVFAPAMAAALVGVVWWGAPWWRSRLARRVPAVSGALPRLMLAVALLAVAAALAARATSDPHALSTWTWASAGIAEVVVAMTASGVRQWRLAPMPRAVGFVATGSATIVVLVGASVFSNDRSWAWTSVVVVSMLVMLTVARRPGRAVRHVPTRARPPRRIRTP